MKKLLLFVIFLFSTLSFAEIDIDNSIELEEYSCKEEIDKTKLNLSQAIKISTLDPIEMKDLYSIRVVKYIYNTLFYYNEKGEITSRLLKRWEWKNERTLILELDNNIRFSNGDNLRARDVQNSLERLKEKGIFKELFSDMDSITVISEKELEIKLRGKNKIFISMLTYYMSSIVKEKDGKLLGTGRYKIEKETNRNIVLVPNQYSSEIAKYKEIEIEYEVSQRKRAISYYNGESDIVFDLTKGNIELWKKEGIFSENTSVEMTNEMSSLVLTFGKTPVLKNRKERKMVEYILYKEGILKKRGIETFFPKDLLNAKLSKLNIEEFSNEELKKISGNQIELVILNSDVYLQLAIEVKKVLANYGIDIKIIPHNIDSYQMVIDSKNFQLAIEDIIYDKRNEIYSITKTVVCDIGDKEMYNGLLPFIEIMKNEEKREYRNKVYDKMIYLVYRNIPYIPLLHRNKMIIKTDRK